MRALVACESSGRVRDALRRRGIDATSCDKLPTKSEGPHYQGDVRDILADRWDAVIAHPDCTFLCSSGLHKRGRMVNGRPRAELTEEAIAFARMFIDGPETAHIPHRVTENPIGCLSTRVRDPDQIIQPWQFGADASKATCLWLCDVPQLVLDQANFYPPRLVVHENKWAMRWANQTDSGQNNLGPSDDRWSDRSLTYPGIAEALAEAVATALWRRDAA